MASCEAKEIPFDGSLFRCNGTLGDALVLCSYQAIYRCTGSDTYGAATYFLYSVCFFEIRFS